MAACIVELEQKCGEEKKKAIKLEDQNLNHEIHIQKLNDSLKSGQKKIDDLEDIIKYDKEHVSQLEVEFCNLKQEKSKLVSSKEKILAKLRKSEEELEQKTLQLSNQQSLLELTKVKMKK